MFFAKSITSSTPFLYTSNNVDETVGDVICISNVALLPQSKGDALVLVKKDGQEYFIANLTKKQPQAAVNFYIQIDQYAEIVVKGNATVHVIGFFEAQPHFDHLDQVQLKHKHQNQVAAQNDHHAHQNQVVSKQQHKNAVNKQEKQNTTVVAQKEHQVNKKPQPKAKLVEQKKQIPKPPQNLKENAFVEQKKIQQDKDDYQDQDQDQDFDEDEEQQQQQQNDNSPLKGLEDIDDDIGQDYKNPSKVKGKNNQNQNKTQNLNNNQQNKKDLNKAPASTENKHQHKQFHNHNPSQNKQNNTPNMTNTKPVQKNPNKLQPQTQNQKHKNLPSVRKETQIESYQNKKNENRLQRNHQKKAKKNRHKKNNNKEHQNTH